MNTTDKDFEVARPAIRRRRRHSASFKTSVVAACKPGISIASVALANGLNANLLRRWVAEAESAMPAVKVAGKPALAAPGFMPVPLDAVPGVAAPAASADIRIELQRSGTTVVVSWPGDAAGACAAWLRELLR